MHDTDIPPTHRVETLATRRWLESAINTPRRIQRSLAPATRVTLSAWLLLCSSTLVTADTGLPMANPNPPAPYSADSDRTELSATRQLSAPPNSGMLMLGAVGNWREALLLDTHIDLSVKGLLADMTLEQRFTNDSSEWLEGKYLFPLPPEAAVRGLTIHVGERKIVGRIMPRQDARETYENARDAGQIASVVEQQRPNLFTVNVASIAPGDDVRIHLDVMLPVVVTNNLYQLTLPTTLTPRYVNNDTPDAPALMTPIAPASQILGPRLHLTATIAPLDSLGSVRSKTHRVSVVDDALVLADVPMDRDISLSWTPPPRATPNGDLFVSDYNAERYVQMLLTPPAQSAGEMESPGRELILVIDRSGSMAGQSINAAKEALQAALDGLTDDDYFNIIAFDDTDQALFSASRTASAAHVESARRFVRQLRADGGTEMSSALHTAINSLDVDRLRQIVFITDGSVGMAVSVMKTSYCVRFNEIWVPADCSQSASEPHPTSTS